MDTITKTLSAAMYEVGFTLQAIGDLHGITRERVRQIFAAQGVPRRKAGGGVTAHPLRQWEDELRRRVLAELVDILDDWPVARVARALGWSAVREVKRPHRRRRSVRRVDEVAALYRAGLTYREIGDVLSLKPNAVCPLVARARKEGLIQGPHRARGRHGRQATPPVA